MTYLAVGQLKYVTVGAAAAVLFKLKWQASWKPRINPKIHKGKYCRKKLAQSPVKLTIDTFVPRGTHPSIKKGRPYVQKF